MAEKSFKKEVEALRIEAGKTFHGEGILAVTKALLESGVSYIGGYQGSPISHLMDVFSDAKPLLDELNIYFEESASEATAAAMLSASVMFPVRGAVTWKSTVGTNVASDALSNLASGGVLGGALIIVGEDYGEGSSIMQERTHAFAMKSQIWLFDPRPNLPSIVAGAKKAFELSEASSTPVIFQMRVRSCHLHGEFITAENQKPKMTMQDCLNNPKRDLNRIVLPPASFVHEKEKEEKRLPAAIKFIKEEKLNEFFKSSQNSEKVGIIVQGGLYNNLNRALLLNDLSDNFGETKIDTYVLNITYPLINDEIVEFCKTKEHVLIIEEGQPNYIEQNISLILAKNDIRTKMYGKDILPYSGEYSTQIIEKGLKKFLDKSSFTQIKTLSNFTVAPLQTAPLSLNNVPARPAGFCIGCPERPIFAALKLVQGRIGEHYISSDIGCNLFSILPPFNIGATTMGYGLSSASSAAFSKTGTGKNDKRAISIMGDGGFWHNGLTTGITNAVYNKSDSVIVIIDNYYAAATGGQDLPSSRVFNPFRKTNNSIEKAVKAVGVKWIRTTDDTYDVSKLVKIFNEALTTEEKGPKIIIASSECMLNKQRREKPIVKEQIKQKVRVLQEKFGVDSEICTGDHECIRLSGCPSLTLTYSDNFLRDDPIAKIDNDCVACGNCGEVAEEAILCPSFYKAQIIKNPNFFDRFFHSFSNSIKNYLLNKKEKKVYA